VTATTPLELWDRLAKATQLVCLWMVMGMFMGQSAFAIWLAYRSETHDRATLDPNPVCHLVPPPR